MTDLNTEQFSQKLENFKETLTDEEKTLFDAILSCAWLIAANENDLSAEFNGSFSPDEADLILAYSAGKLDRLAGLIKGDLIRTSAPLIRTTVSLIRTGHDV